MGNLVIGKLKLKPITRLPDFSITRFLDFPITRFPNYPILAAAILVWSVLVTAQEPPLDTVLTRAGVYVADFKRQLSGIVAEETYVQHITRQPYVQSRGEPDHRELKSDFLLVQADDVDGYEEFRDVFDSDQ